MNRIDRYRPFCAGVIVISQVSLLASLWTAQSESAALSAKPPVEKIIWSCDRSASWDSLVSLLICWLCSHLLYLNFSNTQNTQWPIWNRHHQVWHICPFFQLGRTKHFSPYRLWIHTAKNTTWGRYKHALEQTLPAVCKLKCKVFTCVLY